MLRMLQTQLIQELNLEQVSTITIKECTGKCVRVLILYIGHHINRIQSPFHFLKTELNLYSDI